MSNTLDIFIYTSPLILIWQIIFTLETILLITIGKTFKLTNSKNISGELPGILLILVHSICFFYSIYNNEFIYTIIFIWWGPCFILMALIVLCKIVFNWKIIAIPSSILCKLNYLIMVYIFLKLDYTLPIYLYSIWIMNDQIRLSFINNNADRTRRIFEDYWIFRILYLIYLFTPFIYDSYTIFHQIISIIIFILWIIGLGKVIYSGKFFNKPNTNLENIRDSIYL